MFNDLHISGVDYESMADGPGMRMTVFFSGCLHRCAGCHNYPAQNPKYGVLLEDQFEEIVSEYKKREAFLSGITLSGGDPFFRPNDTKEFVDEFKKRINVPSIWCYTGYTYEQLLEDEQFIPLLQSIDILVDGKYEHKLRNIALRYRGSGNQRIIDVRKSLEQQQAVLWEDDDEIIKMIEDGSIEDINDLIEDFE